MVEKTGNAAALDATIRQELARSIRKMARDAEWRLHFAFERAGCSCHPQRSQLALLEEEKKARLATFEKEIDGDLGKRIEALEREIEEIDEREHPSLDSMGRRASYFFALWMLERLRDGDTSFLDDTSEVRERRFAEGWIHGWRPALRR